VNGASMTLANEVFYARVIHQQYGASYNRRNDSTLSPLSKLFEVLSSALTTKIDDKLLSLNQTFYINIKSKIDLMLPIMFCFLIDSMYILVLDIFSLMFFVDVVVVVVVVVLLLLLLLLSLLLLEALSSSSSPSSSSFNHSAVGKTKNYRMYNKITTFP
jgi:hypothetical protein